MNLAVDWVDYLRERGHDCEHWSRIGDGNAPDEKIVDHCAREDAVVLTADLDFGWLLAISDAGKPSVVQIRASDQLPTAIGHSVARALVVARHQLQEGAIVTITPDKVRVAKLPLASFD